MKQTAVERRCVRGEDAPAFTLIELLTVIAIMGILAALLLTGVTRSKAAAKAAACVGHLHQISLALQMYVQESENRMPVMYDAPIPGITPPEPAKPTMDVVLRVELGNPDVLRCVADDQRLFEQTRSSYSWNFLLNGKPADRLSQLDLQSDPHNVWLFSDKDSFHRARGPKKARNFLYADGHLQNFLVVEGTLPGQ